MLNLNKEDLPTFRVAKASLKDAGATKAGSRGMFIKVDNTRLRFSGPEGSWTFLSVNGLVIVSLSALGRFVRMSLDLESRFNSVILPTTTDRFVVELEPIRSPSLAKVREDFVYSNRRGKLAKLALRHLPPFAHRVEHFPLSIPLSADEQVLHPWRNGRRLPQNRVARAFSSLSKPDIRSLKGLTLGLTLSSLSLTFFFLSLRPYSPTQVAGRHQLLSQLTPTLYIRYVLTIFTSRFRPSRPRYSSRQSLYRHRSLRQWCRQVRLQELVARILLQ